MINYIKLLIIVTLISIMSCVSDNFEVTEFKGIVLLYPSLEPISNIDVAIGRNDGVEFGSFVDLVYDTVRTNNNGIYSYKTSKNDKLYYRIDMVNDNYVTISSPILIAKLIKQNSMNSDTIIIGESAFLKLNLKNNNQDSNDSLFVTVNQKIIVNGDVVLAPNENVLRLYPQYNDTSILYELSYDLYETTIIKWSILDKINYKEESAEINLTPRDTTSFTIEF